LHPPNLPDVKNGLIRTLATFAVVALIAGPLAPTPARAADPYQIDVILSLTGAFAFLGTAEAESLKTLEAQINKEGGIKGQPVHFNLLDDQTNPAVAVQLANGIIAKHPPAMLGPTFIASCLAIAPLMRNGPVDYCFAPTVHPAAGSYVFSGGASSYDQAIETLVFAKAKGWKRLAEVTTNDATGQDIGGQFNLAIKDPRFSGMSFVVTEHYNATDVSVGAQLANVKAANPDAIFGMTVGAATGTLMRGLRDAGLSNVPFMTNLGNVLNEALAQYSSFIPTDFYSTAPRFYARDTAVKGPVRDAEVAYYKAFNAKNIDPDVGNGFPWDPTLVVIAGLRKLGTNTDAKTLLAYIESAHGEAGINGIMDYRGRDQRGEHITSLIIVKWNAAKKRVDAVSHPGGAPL
jgi:branched-chain amino acid transport system substrate-binding protein